MPRTPEQLARIKVLFEKLYDAHRWTQAHPAIDYSEKYINVIVPAVEGWCDELETLDINRTFAMCIYSFGSDWEFSYTMVLDRNDSP